MNAHGKCWQKEELINEYTLNEEILVEPKRNHPTVSTQRSQAQEVDSLKIDTQIFHKVFDSRSHSSQYAL
jgi:hypothetical protein